MAEPGHYQEFNQGVEMMKELKEIPNAEAPDGPMLVGVLNVGSGLFFTHVMLRYSLHRPWCI
jgi:hypothetical protein